LPVFFFSSRRRHTRWPRDWSSDVCSSDLAGVGYPVLFGFVAAESAGALVPGETALIVAAALAADGQLSLPLVIAIAAVAAIIGRSEERRVGKEWRAHGAPARRR